MSARTIDASTLRSGLLGACDAVLAARGRLTELDAVAGDGDLGESLAIGFQAVRAALAALADGDDVGELLGAAGKALSQSAPSTFGTLLGLALVDAGRSSRGLENLDGAAVVRMVAVMADGVARRGDVAAGMRTVLDGLLASRDAAAAAGEDAFAVLAAVATGAMAGAEATKQMSPQVGRAGWIGERALGHADAGATAWAVIAGGLSEGCG